jgi:hypothetical protein
MDIDKIIFSFLEASIPFEGIKDCRIIDVTCCVVGKETPIGQHISKTQTIWQLSAGEEKSILLRVKTTTEAGKYVFDLRSTVT